MKIPINRKTRRKYGIKIKPMSKAENERHRKTINAIDGAKLRKEQEKKKNA